jgi:hypothetical protein
VRAVQRTANRHVQIVPTRPRRQAQDGAGAAAVMKKTLPPEAVKRLVHPLPPREVKRCSGCGLPLLPNGKCQSCA